jgi:hypothetical protein
MKSKDDESSSKVKVKIPKSTSEAKHSRPALDNNDENAQNWNDILNHHELDKNDFFESLKEQVNEVETATEKDNVTAQKKEENHRLRDKLKKKIFEHAATTSLHGYPHIIRNKYWPMKIYWILCCCLFIALAIWLTVPFYTLYFSYPVISVINEVVEEQQRFPAVTICNLEPLATQKASDFIKSRIPNFEINNVKSYENLTGIRNGILDEIYKNFDYPTKQSFGHSINEMIFNCQFEEYPCSCQKSVNGDCFQTSQEFIWYYSYKHGNCYTFNSGYTYYTDTPTENSFKFEQSIKTVSKSGVDYGLYLEIYAGTSNTQYAVDQKVFLPIFS